jgi:shikimate kinase
MARLLGERLGWPFVDLDAEIEQEARQTVREIFEREGEAGFRARETAALRRLTTAAPLVLATGGGCVLAEENRSLLAAGLVIWLSADWETLWRRQQGDSAGKERRPPLTSLSDRAEVEETARRREPLYRACADIMIETASRSPADLLPELLEKIRCWMPSPT